LITDELGPLQTHCCTGTPSARRYRASLQEARRVNDNLVAGYDYGLVGRG